MGLSQSRLSALNVDDIGNVPRCRWVIWTNDLNYQVVHTRPEESGCWQLTIAIPVIEKYVQA